MRASRATIFALQQAFGGLNACFGCKRAPDRSQKLIEINLFDRDQSAV
jgi:hypothetical protein